jgi:hypothetical protein
MSETNRSCVNKATSSGGERILCHLSAGLSNNCFKLNRLLHRGLVEFDNSGIKGNLQSVNRSMIK